MATKSGFVSINNGAMIMNLSNSILPFLNVGYRPDDTLVKCGEDILVVFSDYDNSYMLYNFGSVIGSRVKSDTGSIFVPSVTPANGCCIQNISGMKWILNFDAGYLQTVRTTYDIRYASHSDGCYMLEIWQNNTDQKFFLAKREGLTIVLSDEFDSQRSIVRVGDNLMVAGDKKILVYSVLGMQKIAEIDCSVITEQSVLKYCSAGILCQTDANLYLINKL